MSRRPPTDPRRGGRPPHDHRRRVDAIPPGPAGGRAARGATRRPGSRAGGTARRASSTAPSSARAGVPPAPEGRPGPGPRPRVELCLDRLERHRRIATRCERLAAPHLGTAQIASALVRFEA